MTRRERTKILIKGSKDVSEKFAQDILGKYDVKTVEEANNGLVMVKVREKAQRSLFYLGEVLITECKVMLNGSLGIGIIQGLEPELAYHLAIIDAAYNASLPESQEWTNVLRLEEERIKEKAAEQNSLVLKTKVNFETMDV